jgi:hypothetical protein
VSVVSFPTRPVKLSRAASRYEARAVWAVGHHFESQPVALFDKQPLHARPPNEFGTYEVGGAHIDTHVDRAEAEKHAAELNGGAQS